MIDILCKDIIKHLHVNRVVETGTHTGETVEEVCGWSEDVDVFSVDIDRHSYLAAKEHFSGNHHVYLSCASSEVFLTTLLMPDVASPACANTYLFFLDAHWRAYWPLRDEIQVIQTLDRYLMVIDDFFVPGRSDPALPYGRCGFDVYQKRILNWGYVCDLFQGTRVRIFYPQRPNRDRRGWVLIVKGYSAEQLAFLRHLELFEMDQWDGLHRAPADITWQAYWDWRVVLKAALPVFMLRRVHRFYERYRRRRLTPRSGLDIMSS